MSDDDVPLLDILEGVDAPSQFFGAVAVLSSREVRRFQKAAATARGRVEEGFRRMWNAPGADPRKLDEIIDEMWDQGWVPDIGDLNLFSTDFGLILTEAIFRRFGGKLVVRSEVDFKHCSIWWPEKRLEAFPFHRVLKRLYKREGDSIEFLIAGIAAFLDEEAAAGKRRRHRTKRAGTEGGKRRHH